MKNELGTADRELATLMWDHGRSTALIAKALRQSEASVDRFIGRLLDDRYRRRTTDAAAT